ncbi:MAG TPA: hypothetical protein VFV91_02300 [Gaiellaceae bacterium]|jgi:hypothetical protein|nr:hypothetical protein [Gaiellaceae bacterium]
MTIMNRRNAVVGFLTLKVGKVVARRKAKQVGGKLTSWRSKDGKSEKNGKKSD